MRYLLFVSHGALAAGMAQALGMLVGEREEGTLLLIKPTRRGYLETIAAKLASR